MRSIILICHNVRSCHNVGSLLRTADGLGIERVYLTGHTPYPTRAGDARMPHVASKIQKQITKTALGAEESVNWIHEDDVIEVISTLKTESYTVIALDQTPNSLQLPAWNAAEEKIAIVVGREVEGIEPEVIDACDLSLEIPMLGTKESFNVVQAAAMALYHFRFN